jgi:hypothetical protein
MTRGVLLFASNNDAVKYTDLAEIAAVRCKQYLNVSVSIVTETPDQIKTVSTFDQIITVKETVEQYKKFNNSNQFKISQWKNFSRADAYDLSPYDETLVIDVDYFLYTDKLKWCFDQPGDLVIAKRSQDVSYTRDNSEFVYLGATQLDFYWATVFFFRKTLENKIFFDFVSHIKDNWRYYKHQYQFNSHLYRNDFSFTIAAHVLKELVTDLPFPLFYIIDKDQVVSFDDISCKIIFNKDSKEILSDIRNIDIHVMNKLALKDIIDV